MRIPKIGTLIFLLICGSVALAIDSAAAFHPGDALEGTMWSDSELDFSFQKGSKLMVDDGECCGTRGTYQVNGASVEMALVDGARASGTISGNSMAVKLTFEGKTEEHVLAKRMRPAASLAASLTTAVEYYIRGNERRDKQDSIGATADYTKAIELDPKYAEAYFNRGKLWAKRGDNAAAIADYTKVIELNPRYTEAYSGRAFARHEGQDCAGAIADYTKVIELDSAKAFAAHYLNRGLCRAAGQDLEGAIGDFTKAIELDPKSVKAHYNRARARIERNDFAGGIADYTKVIELDPTDHGAHLSRAGAYRKWGKPALAEADEEKFHELERKAKGTQ